jgi:hypothetical protein
MDLEKLGLRDASFPFDWCITSFQKNIELIENKFKDFMNFDNLAQSTNHRQHYLDTKYDFFFFHDFSKYKPLNDQLYMVRKKYLRRINRLFERMKEPTLFFRYISNEEKNRDGKSIELIWIEENYDYINTVIKKYNKNNEIIFISDLTLTSHLIKIHNVDIDKDDIVSRSPLINSIDLYSSLCQINRNDIHENKLMFYKKSKRKTGFFYKLSRKLRIIYKDLFYKVYIHFNQYNIKNK